MSVFSKERLAAMPDPLAPPARHAVLIVDDEEGNLRVLSWMLAERYRVLEARDGREALELLGSMDAAALPSVVLSDQRMPRMSGVELFERMRERYPATLRIMLTGVVDVAATIDAVNRGGVYRFVVKPCDREELLRTVAAAVELFERRRDEHDALQRDARQRSATDGAPLAQQHDPLTGLALRQRLSDPSLASTGCGGRSCAWLLLDIDALAAFNRRHGEAAGDALLVAVAEVVRAQCVDAVAVRWSGDAFLLRLAVDDADQANQRAAALHAAIGAIVIGGERVRCSLGVACLPSAALADPAAAPAAIELAAAALADAQQRGGDGIVVRPGVDPTAPIAAIDDAHCARRA